MTTNEGNGQCKTRLSIDELLNLNEIAYREIHWIYDPAHDKDYFVDSLGKRVKAQPLGPSKIVFAREEENNLFDHPELKVRPFYISFPNATQFLDEDEARFLLGVDSKGNKKALLKARLEICDAGDLQMANAYCLGMTYDCDETKRLAIPFQYYRIPEKRHAELSLKNYPALKTVLASRIRGEMEMARELAIARAKENDKQHRK